VSFQFKSPLANETAIAWGDLWRIGAEADPFWQRVRAARVTFLARWLPFMLAIAIANMSVVLGGLAHLAPLPVLGLWLLATLVMGSIWVARLARQHPPGAGLPATRAYHVQTLLELSVVGIAWGLLFATMLPGLNEAQRTLVVAMTVAAAGCAIFTTSIFPLAAVALAGPMVAGTLVGLLLAGIAYSSMVLVVLLSFLIVAVRGNILTTFAFLARLRTQERLMEQEEVVRLLLNEFETNGSDWLFEFDSRRRLTFVSTRFAETAHATVESLLGRSWTRLFTDRQSAAPLFRAVVRRQAFRDILVRVRIGGEARFWSLSGTPKFDGQGRFSGYRGVGSDVTERQKSAERIAELATFDSLTGLVNRRIIHTAIADGLAGPTGVALLFVDLDRFKAVNDSLGHAAGDRLLAEVAQRLRQQVGAAGQIGRLGGDEFAVVLRDADAVAATALGEALIADLSRPFRLGASDARIGASIGLAVGPEDGATVEALMRAADLALYDVKGKGRGSVRRYDRDMHARAEARHALELDLKVALERDQIRLVFQPIVDALDEQIVGFEALMRWRHPLHGDVPPSLFIPLAEDCGVIGPLGRFALNEALRVAAGWPRHIRISVNLSPIQVEDPQLIHDIRRALAASGVDPGRLELELTESVFLDPRESVVRALAELRALGCAFALDDFGTGYSSLGYLQKIAFNRIKIDRSFVRASVEDGGESSAIIQAIVALADRLGMETTAEGTETRAEFEAMRRLGCAYVQGYYFGKPMSAEDVARLLQRNAPLIALEDGELDAALRAARRPRLALQPALATAGAPPDPFSASPPSGAEANGQSRAAVAPSRVRIRPTRLHTPRG
jgi:diguanylate cyclase (GGDEF)-like protein/PAS domain S-box-containing protein